MGKWSQVIHDTQISEKQDEYNRYVIRKAMHAPGYHYKNFVATHVLGYMMYDYTLLVTMNQRVLNKLSKEHNIIGHK